MKKIIAFMLIVVCIFSLSGCKCFEWSDEEKQAYTEYLKTQPQYRYDRSNATITNINVHHWYAGIHRYEYEITVECDGMSYSYSGCVSGMWVPSFIGKGVGDTVDVEFELTYINGKLVNKCISRIL